jgi:hypothetical protein
VKVNGIAATYSQEPNLCKKEDEVGNRNREDRTTSTHVVQRHHERLRKLRRMHLKKSLMKKEIVEMKSCPFGCSHHIFPNHYKFCPYCGTKLALSEIESTVSLSRFKTPHKHLRIY